jgi:hypothetical protein
VRTIRGRIQPVLTIYIPACPGASVPVRWNWSNDKKNFPVELWKSFVDKLRNELHRHYVLILDPAIPEDGLNDPAYTVGHGRCALR